MAKYMVQGSYTNEGLTSLLKDDGVKRRKVVVNSVSELGGTLESYYFAFGENGFYLIADMQTIYLLLHCLYLVIVLV
ncbi:MAG TPA: hypothetical protein DCL76_05735 [Chloroflexi bacterium]|nr:hypothetical protein [Chloroflexota bacterium]|tara:strand:- start:1420 stop:1650 length:231 start_codon:yes stop_codon:yes gene_type:complete